MLKALQILQRRVMVEFLTGVMLLESRSCSFGELFEDSGLESLGVSMSTLSRVLKDWMAQGIIEKAKAPLPRKAVYRVCDEKKMYALLEDIAINLELASIIVRLNINSSFESHSKNS